MPITVAQLRTELEGDIRPLEQEVRRAHALLETFARRTFPAARIRADVSEAERAIGQVAQRVQQLSRQIQRDVRDLSRVQATINVRVDAEAVPGAVRQAVAQAEAATGVVDLRLEVETRDLMRDFARVADRVTALRREIAAPIRLPEVPPIRLVFAADRASLDRALVVARDAAPVLPLRFARPVLPEIPPIPAVIRPRVEFAPGGAAADLRALITDLERQAPTVGISARFDARGLRGEIPAELEAIARALPPLEIRTALEVGNLAREEAELRARIQQLGRRLAAERFRLPAATVPVEVEGDDLPARLRAAVTAVQRTLLPVTIRTQLDARALGGDVEGAQRALAPLREPIVIPVQVSAESLASELSARLRAIGSRFTLPITAGRGGVNLAVNLATAGLPERLRTIAAGLSRGAPPIPLRVEIAEAGAFAAAERLRTRLAQAAEPTRIDLPEPAPVPLRLVLDTEGVEQAARAFVADLSRRLPPVTVRADLEPAALAEGLEDAERRVAAFDPRALAELDVDIRPLSRNLQAAERELDDFEREMAQAQRQLATLRAPNLEGRLAIRFPGVPPQAIASLAATQREIERLEGAARRAHGPLNALDDILQGGLFAGAALAINQNVTRPILAAGTAAVQTAVRMDAATAAIAGFQGSEQAARSLDSLRQMSERTGFAISDLTGAYLDFAAAGLTPSEATRTLQGLTQGALAAGRGVEDVRGAALQLSQVLSSGKLQGDELNILRERIPGIGQALRQVRAEFGGIDLSDLVKSGTSVNEIVSRLTGHLLALRAPTNTAQQSLNRMNAELDRVREEIGRTLLPVVQEFARVAIPALREFREAWGSIPRPVQVTIAAVVGLIGPIGQVAFSIAGLSIALNAMRLSLVKVPADAAVAATGIRGVGLAALAARTAVGGFAVAATLGIGALVTNWKGARDFFVAGSQLIVAALERIGATFGALVDAFDRLTSQGLRGTFEALQQDLANIDAQFQRRLQATAIQLGIAVRTREEAERKLRAALDAAQAPIKPPAVLPDTSIDAAAQKMREKFRDAIADVRKELALLRAPDLLAKLRVEFPGIPEDQLRELARLTTLRDREQEAIERTARAVEELRQKLGQTAESILRNAERLPGRLGSDVRGFARQLQGRAEGTVGDVGIGPTLTGADAQRVMEQNFGVQAEAIRRLGTRYGELGCARAVSSILSGSVSALEGLNEASVTGLVRRLTGLGAQEVARGQQQPGDVAVFAKGILSTTNRHIGVVAEVNKQLGLIHNSTKSGLRLAFDPGLERRATTFLRLPEQLAKVAPQIQTAAAAVQQFSVRIREVDPGRAFVRVGEVIDTLTGRLVGVRQEIAKNATTTTEGRIAIELLGDSYARTHPLVQRLAAALSAAENVLRAQEIAREVGQAWNQARVAMLAAQATTDAQRLSLESLSLSLESLPPRLQAAFREMAEFRQVETVTRALSETRNELLQFTAAAGEQRIALELLGQSYSSLGPAAQAGVRELARLRAEVNEWRRAEEVAEAVASLRREIALTAATSARDAAAIEQTGETFDRLMSRFIAVAQVRIARPPILTSLETIQEALGGGAVETLGGNVDRLVSRVTTSLSRLSDASRPARELGQDLADFQQQVSGLRFDVSIGSLATDLLGLPRQLQEGLSSIPQSAALLRSLEAPLESLRQAAAVGGDLEIRTALTDFRAELERVQAAVGETNPELAAITALFRTLAGVVELADLQNFRNQIQEVEDRFRPLREQMEGFTRGAREAAADLREFGLEQRIEARELEVMRQAVEGVSAAFVLQSGDIEQVIAAAQRADPALGALRRQLIEMQVVMDRTGGAQTSIADFARQVQQDLQTAPAIMAPLIVAQLEAVRQEVEARIARDAAGRQRGAEVAAAQRTVDITRAIQQEMGQVAQRIAEINAGGDTQAQLLARLNLTYQQLTEEQQRWIAGLVEQTQALQRLEAVQQFAEGLQQVFSNAFDQLGSGFDNFFGSVIEGFQNMLVRMAHEFLASQLANLFLGGLQSVFGGGFGQLLGQIAGGSRVGAGRQSGGFIPAGVITPVGEHGRTEFFMSRTSGGMATAQQIARAFREEGVTPGGGGGDTFHFHFHGITNRQEWEQSKQQVAGDMARIMRLYDTRRGV